MPGGLEVSNCVFVFTHSLAALAGGEGCSRPFQMGLKCRGERVRATEHAPRCPFYFLECRHRLAEIVERGGGVPAERLRVNRPHLAKLQNRFAE